MSAGDTAAADPTPAGDGEPLRPSGRVAPDTHPVELARLALQERTHPDCRPLAVQVYIWLSRAYNAAVTAQAAGLRSAGLSPSAFNVLMALVNTPGNTLEPWALAERLLVTRPSVTGLLDTLQAKGLIERRRQQGDHRRVLVALTPQAWTLLEGLFPVHYAELNDLVAGLCEAEQAQLVGLLGRLRDAAPAHLAPVEGPGPADSGDAVA